jgi:hypothetical protein
MLQRVILKSTCKDTHREPQEQDCNQCCDDCGALIAKDDNNVIEQKFAEHIANLPVGEESTPALLDIEDILDSEFLFAADVSQIEHVINPSLPVQVEHTIRPLLIDADIRAPTVDPAASSFITNVPKDPSDQKNTTVEPNKFYIDDPLFGFDLDFGELLEPWQI